MTPRMTIKPELYHWACNRSPVDPEKLRERFPMFDDWVGGDKKPTLKQLEKFAKFTHVPVGTLFLSTPLEEKLPIQDLRTVGDYQISEPSANLLDTISQCQRRQNWYRNFTIAENEKPLPFVGSASIDNDPMKIASEIQTTLKFDLKSRKKLSNWTYALRYFIDQADDTGILIMVSGTVGGNQNRKLDPKEFRGFALADEIAPLIFINGTDTKAAQIFTLAHELAHIWLGQSNLSNVKLNLFSTHYIEKWCNETAAEILVPSNSLENDFQKNQDLHCEIDRLARQYKVSTLVILRRLLDIDRIEKELFFNEYQRIFNELKPKSKSRGGNYYAMLRSRVGQRFGSALVASTLSGETSYTEALRYLEIKKVSTLNSFANSLRGGDRY